MSISRFIYICKAVTDRFKKGFRRAWRVGGFCGCLRGIAIKRFRKHYFCIFVAAGRRLRWRPLTILNPDAQASAGEHGPFGPVSCNLLVGFRIRECLASC